MYGARMDGDASGSICELTVRDGKVVYDLNGLSRPDWRTLPADYGQTGDARWDAVEPGAHQEVTMARVESTDVPEAGAAAAAAAAVRCAPATALRAGHGGQAGEEGALDATASRPRRRRCSAASSRTATWCSSPASARTSRATSRRTPSTCSTRCRRSLESVGSSMEKVLKVNVYLNDLKDYAGMNEVFLGRFGAEPGVRTTIAAAGGIPGNSLVEIDCIAYI